MRGCEDPIESERCFVTRRLVQHDGTIAPTEIVFAEETFNIRQSPNKFSLLPPTLLVPWPAHRICLCPWVFPPVSRFLDHPHPSYQWRRIIKTSAVPQPVPGLRNPSSRSEWEKFSALQTAGVWTRSQGKRELERADEVLSEKSRVVKVDRDDFSVEHGITYKVFNFITGSLSASYVTDPSLSA